MQAVFHSTIVTSLPILRTGRSQRARTKSGSAHRATQTVERILGVKPDHSIETFATDYPQVDQKVLVHFVKGLRKAGLPERARGRQLRVERARAKLTGR